MMRNAVAVACILLALPAWGQSVLSLEGIPEEQRADYLKLMRGYVETFRILGRAKLCRHDFDPEPYWREVKRRHGEKSQAVAVAALGYAAGADNIMIARELEPRPAAPMPCDVVPYMKDMRLPELPASLDPGPPIQGQGRGLRGRSGRDDVRAQGGDAFDRALDHVAGLQE
ncbi:MAG: hypothetical protein QOD26_3760 [Betaproteobacteria bacterium]|jgi:hypothetical protein|nr:hypothetical protein [Betaproteobacteria bacterium]